MDEKMDEGISLDTVIKIFFKNIIMFIIIEIIFLIIGIVYSFGFAKNEYSCSSSIVVVIKDSNQTVDYDASLRLVTTLSGLVEENIVLSPVATKYKKYGVDDVRDIISVSYSTSSFIVKITGTSNDKNSLQDIVDLTVSSLIDVCNSEDYSNLNMLFGNSIQITSYAKDDEIIKTSPSKLMYILIIACVGFVFSALAIILKEIIKDKFNSKDECESYLDSKAIGIIYEDNRKHVNYEKNSLKSLDLHYDFQKTEYNRLITNLKYLTIDNKSRVISLISSASNEQKTTVCLSLGQALAQAGRKSIVLDLDLLRPSINLIYNLPRKNGLTDALAYDDISSFIKRVGSGLDVLTAGIKIDNTLRVLESDALRNIINKLKELYEYVIIDTPPLNAGSDALSISKLSDYSLFILDYKNSKKKQAKENVNLLRSINASVLGLVITRYPIKYRKTYGYYTVENKM